MIEQIKLKDFSFSFPGKELFHRVELEIPLQGLNLLLGKNGSGKSTFCRLLMGLETGYSGSMHFKGREISETAIFTSEIVYLKQISSLNLLAATSIMDLEIWKEGFGLFEPDNSAIREALRYFDLIPLKDKPVWELSEGQRQRAVLAALLLNRQKIWLLDEPAAGLDIEQQKNLKKLIIEQSKEASVLVISHRLDLFADISDKIFEIENKSIILRK